MLWVMILLAEPISVEAGEGFDRKLLRYSIATKRQPTRLPKGPKPKANLS
jgi:hypothetical protein